MGESWEGFQQGVTGPDLCRGKSQVGEGKADSNVMLIQGKRHIGRQVSVQSGGRCGPDTLMGAATTQVIPEEDEGELGAGGRARLRSAGTR